ncbi:MAG: hypothetical protein LBK82_05015 [Planctomycetaceae bacterium]|nr:hypothetical protein [Planctomycetaceae bacterium]
MQHIKNRKRGGQSLRYLLKGSRRLSLAPFQNGWQHHLPSLIWFTVGYRRRNRSANGCPPYDC